SSIHRQEAGHWDVGTTRELQYRADLWQNVDRLRRAECNERPDPRRRTMEIPNYRASTLRARYKDVANRNYDRSSANPVALVALDRPLTIPLQCNSRTAWSRAVRPELVAELLYARKSTTKARAAHETHPLPLCAQKRFHPSHRMVVLPSLQPSPSLPRGETDAKRQ